MKVKVCGITNVADACVAIGAGADYLGFILYPKSPRFVAPETVGEIVAALRARQAGQRPVQFVGVFVNEPKEAVERIVAQAGLDFAQLHGDEQPADLARLRCPAYKAIRPATREQAFAEVEAYWGCGSPDGPRLLIDAYHPAAYGGTGQRADWGVAADLVKQYSNVLLAGGLEPTNVGAAIMAVQPWGVDVSSGVEAAPGRKDHLKVREFVRQALFVE
jgi:phosphoribosylanthranilate isomerase